MGILILQAFVSRKFIVTLLMNTVSGERNTPHGSRGEACDKICGFQRKRELTAQGQVILRIPLDLRSKRKVSKKCYLCKKLTKGER